MVNNQKICGLLGLATRAGKIVAGTDACLQEIEKHRQHNFDLDLQLMQHWPTQRYVEMLPCQDTELINFSTQFDNIISCLNNKKIFSKYDSAKYNELTI